VHPAIDHLLLRCGGVASRRRLLTVVSRAQLDHEIRAGRLVAVFPRAYCRPWDVDQVNERAALVSVGPPAALSHVSAWPSIARVDGLPTVAPAEAIVGAWPLLHPHDRRAPAITAVRHRLVTATALRARLAAHPRLPERSELEQLIELLAAGCESELEIWGHLRVFDIPGLRHGRRQLWVRTPAGRFRLDLGFERERVGIELDGHRYHSSREQRERDMRRDAAFAAIDWLILHFSHERLHADTAGCQRDALAALAARRR
jgi:very-short-patch-repair endonuclease